MTFQELMDCYKISENENNSIVYKELLEMLKKQNITPIIGAGISSWAYPLWEKLLNKLSIGYGIEDEIKQLLENNKYEEAASLLESEITFTGLTMQLKQEFRPQLMDDKANNCPEYLKKFPKLFLGPIVTTNFDQVIEKLFFWHCNSKIDTVTPFDKKPIHKITKALNQKKPILIKMHGDVENSEYLILTKEAYDVTYGTDTEHPNFNLPMPRALKKILEHNPPLFLGCSLNVDRTCSVIKNCATEHVKFAMLELPQETHNGNTPYKPVLHKNNGKLLDTLNKRRKNMFNNFNIRAIWYPPGMHNEAYNALFSQLSKDLGLTSLIDLDNDINYTLLHPLLGRDTLVEKIVEQIVLPSSCVWVEGAAGIGKTEICKEVYSVLKKSYPGLEMPYIDITGISSLSAFFDVVIKETRISIPNPVNGDSISQIVLKKLGEKYSSFLQQHIPVIMYFDNFEDIWDKLTSKTDRDNLINWICRLMANNINVLVSSRDFSPSIPNCVRYHVDPLDNGIENISSLKQKDFDKLNSVNLFYNILGRTIAPREKRAFRSLIEQLEGHPLAIVLTATQAQKEISLNGLLDRWDKARQDTFGMRDAHQNLTVALKVSWNVISTNTEAVIQWGLLYYSLKEIPTDIFEKLRGDIDREAWCEGFSVLKYANLVDVTSDRSNITMLLPLKKQFAYFTEENRYIQESCLIRWAIYIDGFLDITGKSLSAKQSLSYPQVVKFTPQILYIMEQLMTFGTEKSGQYLDQIVKKVRRFYELYVQSENLLKKLIQYYKERDSNSLLSIVLEDYGSLLRRLGKLDEAQKAYDKAEILYREKTDTREFADLLKSKGDLLRRLGKLDEAKRTYDKAEVLYRQKADNRRLANLLVSRGELLCQLNSLGKANEAYNQAELLYCQEADSRGMADMLKSKGDMFQQQNSLHRALELYNKAEQLYFDNGDVIRLEALLKSRKDLLRRLTPE